MRFTRFAGFVMFYKRAILSWWLIQITVKILKKNDVLFVFPKKGLYFRRVKFSSWGAYLLPHKRRVGNFHFRQFHFPSHTEISPAGVLFKKISKTVLEFPWHLSQIT